MAQSTTYPPDFIAQLKQQLGAADSDLFFSALQTPAITSVRINPIKATTKFNHLPAVAWCPEGRYLKERPLFTADPLFHAGAYYVQEASSMFLAHALKQTLDTSRPIKALDLCASPGGKSTLIASLLNDESLLLANEVIKTRANILAENLVKWGQLNTFVSNNDPSHFAPLAGFFNLVLVDAPCSGEGLFRKDPASIDAWSLAHVQHCAARQKRILSDAALLVQANGLLIYSTCTYNPIENDNNLRYLQEQHNFESIALSVPESWGITKTGNDKLHGYQFYPHRTLGEGFFLAVLQKNGGKVFKSIKKKRHKKESAMGFQPLPAKQAALVAPFLNPDIAVKLLRLNDELYAIPSTLLSAATTLQSHLYLKKAGTHLGKLYGTQLLPSHELALSPLISPNYPSISVNHSQALQYLQKKPLSLATKGKGWHLIRYENYPLGWVKLLDNRMNNYYPKQWRIRLDL